MTLLLFIPLIGGGACLSPGASGAAIPSCGSVQSTYVQSSAQDTDATNTGDDDSTGNGSTQNSSNIFNGPIDMPITISKAIEGVDADTMEFSPTNTNIIHFLTTSGQAAPNSEGMVSFRTVDRECGQVVVFVGNTYYATLISNDDCLYTMSIPSSLIEQDISLVQLSETATVSSDGVIAGETSIPRGMVINRDNDVLGSLTLTVIATMISENNPDSDLKGSLSSSAPLSFLNIDGRDDIVFPVSIDTSSFELWSISTDGGLPTPLFDLDGMYRQADQVVDNDDLIFIKSNSQKPYMISQSNGVSLLSFNGYLEKIISQIAVDPGGNYMAYSGSDEIQNFVINTDAVVPGIYDIKNDVDYGLVNLTGLSFSCLYIDYDWHSVTELILTCNGTDGNWHVISVNLENFLFDNSPDAEAQILYTSDDQILEPKSTGGARNLVYFTCYGDDLTRDICQYNLNDDSVATVVDMSFDISNLKLSKDLYSYLMYQIDYYGEDVICIYSIIYDERLCLVKGSSPSPSNLSLNFVAYYGDFAGTTQVSFAKLPAGFFDEYDDMVLSPSSGLLPVNANNFISVTGGVPPYTFGSSGVGEIDPVSGLFFSSQTGDAVITVTDNEGETIQGSFEVEASGNLDRSFNSDGIAELALGDQAVIRDVYRFNSGKLLITGKIENGAQYDIFVARLDSDGELDNDFGTNGIVTYDFNNGDDEALKLLVHANGDIYFCGSAKQAGVNKAIIGRMDEDGVLDNAFNGDGIFTSAVAGATIFRDLKLDSSDKLVAVGTSNSMITGLNFYVVRLDTAGALDANFGTAGTQTVNFSGGADEAYSVEITVNDNVIVGGYARDGGIDKMAIAKLSSAGTLDVNFGAGGKIMAALGNADNKVHRIKIVDNNNVLVGGYSKNGGENEKLTFARITAAAALDNTFGTNGITKIDLGSDARVYDVEIMETTQEIYAVGQSDSANSDFVIVKLTEEGDVDQTFGTNGIVETTIGTHAIPYAITIQNNSSQQLFNSNAKLIVVGFSQNVPLTGTDNIPIVTKYWP